MSGLTCIHIQKVEPKQLTQNRLQIIRNHMKITSIKNYRQPSVVSKLSYKHDIF